MLIETWDRDVQRSGGGVGRAKYTERDGARSQPHPDEPEAGIDGPSRNRIPLWHKIQALATAL